MPQWNKRTKTSSCWSICHFQTSNILQSFQSTLFPNGRKILQLAWQVTAIDLLCTYIRTASYGCEHTYINQFILSSFLKTGGNSSLTKWKKRKKEKKKYIYLEVVKLSSISLWQISERSWLRTKHEHSNGCESRTYICIYTFLLVSSKTFKLTVVKTETLKSEVVSNQKNELILFHSVTKWTI